MSALGTSEQTMDLVPYYRAKWAMEQAVAESGPRTRRLPSELHLRARTAARSRSSRASFATSRSRRSSAQESGNCSRSSSRTSPKFFARAVSLPEAANQTFELGGPERITWNELWERLAAALGKRRARVHLPVSLVRVPATVLERLPKAPVTRDQLTMLEAGDNVCDPWPAAKLFGIELTPLDEQLRRSLDLSPGSAIARGSDRPRPARPGALRRPSAEGSTCADPSVGKLA